MKTIAYLRVSKDTQDVNHQKLAILQFAQQEGIGVSQFIELTVSSRKSEKQRRLPQLLSQLDGGDTLIVSELSRMGLGALWALGKSSPPWITWSNERYVSSPSRRGFVTGSQDIGSKVMVTMFGLFAEIERELISLRTKEALAAAKAAGKPLGRPKGGKGRSKLDSRKAEIEQLLRFGVSKSAIARITSVDRTTLYHFIKSRGLVF